MHGLLPQKDSLWLGSSNEKDGNYAAASSFSRAVPLRNQGRSRRCM
jgi:hypothetical protein